MSSTYAISSRTLTVRDTPEHIDLHIETGDYFAMLATVMGFMQEGLEECKGRSREHELAQELRQDLRYLQQHYRIVRKD
jgi:hypothetical protein